MIIRETLTRIGIYTKTKKNENIIKLLKQICYCVNIGDEHYILHAKEILGKKLTDIDYARRNTVAKMLENWGEVKILNQEEILEHGTILSLFILNHADSKKPGWKFETPVSKEDIIRWKENQTK